MRLIDADALIEALEEDEPEVWIPDEYTEGQHAQYLLDLAAIKAAPTVHQWRSVATFGPPTENGWYLVYAPDYIGGSSGHKECINGYMFAKWNGKSWSIERCYYNRPGCVKAWMPIFAN